MPFGRVRRMLLKRGRILQPKRATDLVFRRLACSLEKESISRKVLSPATQGSISPDEIDAAISSVLEERISGILPKSAVSETKETIEAKIRKLRKDFQKNVQPVLRRHSYYFSTSEKHAIKKKKLAEAKAAKKNRISSSKEKVVA